MFHFEDRITVLTPARNTNMGQFFSDIFKDSAEEVKEEIKVLEKLGHSIMEAQSERMEAKAYEDKSLPIVAIVDTIKMASMSAQSGASDNVHGIVDSLFSGQILDGFKKAVTTAVDTFLGNAEAGEDERSEFHVIYSNNAMLRVDVYFYKYQFSSEALKKHGSNLFCYVAQIGVLDTSKTSPQVILYEVTKSIGGDVEDAKKLLQKDAEFVEMFLNVLRNLTNEQKDPKVTAGTKSS